MDILSLNLKAPYTRTNESAVIFNNISNLIPNINTSMKRLLRASSAVPRRRHSTTCSELPVVPSIEVIPPSPGSPDLKLPFEIVEINKFFADTLNLCRKKIRRFSEPSFQGQLDVSKLEGAGSVSRTRRKSMPCIPNKHLLKVPKQSRKKKRHRRLSLPSKPEESDFADYDKNWFSKDFQSSRSLSGSYEKIHYCQSDDEGGIPKTVHEIFIPGFGLEDDAGKKESALSVEAGKRRDVGGQLHYKNDVNGNVEFDNTSSSESSTALAFVISDKNERNGNVEFDRTSEYNERATAASPESSTTTTAFVNGFDVMRISGTRHHNIISCSKPQHGHNSATLNGGFDDVIKDKQASLINSIINTSFNINEHHSLFKSKDLSRPTDTLLKNNTIVCLGDRDDDCQELVKCIECNMISSDDNSDVEKDERTRMTVVQQKADRNNCERTTRCLGCSSETNYDNRVGGIREEATVGEVDVLTLLTDDLEVKSQASQHVTRAITTAAYAGSENVCLHPEREREATNIGSSHADNCPTRPRDNESSLIIITSNASVKPSLSVAVGRKDNYCGHNLEQENIKRIEELTSGNNGDMKSLDLLNKLESVGDDELHKQSYDGSVSVVSVVDSDVKTTTSSNQEVVDDNVSTDVIMSPTRSFSNVLSDVLSGKTDLQSESNVLFGFHNGGSKDILPRKVVYNAKNDDVSVLVTHENNTSEGGGTSSSSEEEDMMSDGQPSQTGLTKATSLTGLDSFKTSNANKKKGGFKPELRAVSLHEDTVNNPELLETLSSIEGSSGGSNQPGIKSRDENKPTSASMEELDERRHSSSHRVSALNRLNKDFANAMLRKAVSLVEIQNERLKENIAKFDQKFLSTEVLSAPDGAGDSFPRVSMEDCSSCASCRSRSSSYHSLLYDFDTANRYPIYQPTVIDFNEEDDQSSVTETQADEEGGEGDTETRLADTEVAAATAEDTKTKILKAKKERLMKQGQAAFGSFKDRFRRVKSKV